MNTSKPAAQWPVRGRYADILTKCRNTVLIVSETQLAEVFEHAYTALLEFAERAESNSVEGQFLDAMQVIESRRRDIERVFRKGINDGFENPEKLNRPPHTRGPRGKNAAWAELSLVEHDQLDESIAVENLTVKANATYLFELNALSLRFALVYEGVELKDYKIPGGPDHLVQSFQRALDVLAVGVKIKLVLYALFDRFVIKRAKGLYDELNGYLEEAGILANLAPIAIGSDQKSRTAKAAGKQRDTDTNWEDRWSDSDSAGKNSQQALNLGEELFGAIIDLMSSRRVGKKNRGRQSAVPGSPAQRAAAAAASRDLLAALHDIQIHKTADSVRSGVLRRAEISSLEAANTAIAQVKEALLQEREQALSHIDREHLPSIDADLIDLVGMLFEYMLNAPVLPDVAKALLSHLHTPYLKVALIDRRLLVDANHPARLLFDQLVEAGGLWVDESSPKQGIFPAMQEIVNRVLKEFSDDVSLFKDLLVSFELSMKEQRRKTDAIEHRTQSAALGREKLQLATSHARKQIQLLVQRTPLPVPVADFLSKTWLDRLVFILLRNREEDRSDAWLSAVKVAQELVALFDPEDSVVPSGTDMDSTKGLRARIADGVQSMGSYPRVQLDALFKYLDIPETWRKSPEKAVAAHMERARVEKAPERPSAHEGRPVDREAYSEKEQKVIHALSKMKPGVWFEFKSMTGGAPRRIKLSWRSPVTETCMFVDRSGIEAEVKTMGELARDILSGRAKVILRPKRHFIERALVSIRKMLQTEKKTVERQPPAA